MKGSDFVAVEKLSDRFGAVLAAPGASCDKVPESSLGWLLRDGLIQPKPKRKSKDRASEGKE